MENQPQVPHPPTPAPPLAVRHRVLPPRKRKRRVWLPVTLFLLTCITTFWAGASREAALLVVVHPAIVLELVPKYWLDGLLYMAALMSILLAHEMGHFVMTLWHRIPASLPFFIPMPLNPIGTMGAIIGMQASKANRKELFDIGIAGPLAGLFVALPVMWYAISHYQPDPNRGLPDLHYHDPLLVTLLLDYLRPGLPHGDIYWDPLLKAGWVGLLITGLNMLPISQLDGGHISHALFGRRARWLARGLVVAAIVFTILAKVYIWIVMLVLIKLIGIDHPPTADDQVPLGWCRWLLGLASLAIPVLCFPPMGIS